MELPLIFASTRRTPASSERTLIIKQGLLRELPRRLHRADARQTAPAAVVELVALDDAETVLHHQNWYPVTRREGHLHSVTKREIARSLKILDSGRDRPANTWKYPGRILRGDNSMANSTDAIRTDISRSIPAPRCSTLARTPCRIISKGIAAGHPNNTYRGPGHGALPRQGARNFTNCDSLLIGGARRSIVPYIEAKNSSAVFEHEATTKIFDDMLFYCMQRGLSGD